MILRKPLGEVPHEGGLRLVRDSKTYEFLRDWVAEGAKDDPGAPAAVSLEIRPGSRVLNAPARSQQITAIVKYADGSARDITPLCYYDSSNPEIAAVDAEGHVVFKNRGEVAVISPCATRAWLRMSGLPISSRFTASGSPTFPRTT